MSLLEAENYWVRQSFKVDLTTGEKRKIGKPSMPRPETFVGIFGGIMLAVLFVFVLIGHLIGAEGTRVPPTVGVVFALIAVLPAWMLALKAIQRPHNAA
jgi:Mg/Co/Ni transporter MgtE